MPGDGVADQLAGAPQQLRKAGSVARADKAAVRRIVAL
jgi:hypothetical protein